MRTNCLCMSVVLFAICGARVAVAQEKTFFDAVEVKVASVEVVVEDKDGRKISGLTSDDFQIFEDGKPQELAYFSALEDGKAIVVDGEELTAPPVAPPTDRVHLAIFVDDVHLSTQNRNQVFDRLRQYLKESLKPTDQVLIARLSDRLTIEQPFTSDVAALDATLDRLAENAGAAMQIEASYRRILRAVASTPLGSNAEDEEAGVTARRAKTKISGQEVSELQARNQAQEILAFAEERRVRVLATVKALETAIDSMAGLNGRKALVYLSDGLPVRAAEGLATVWRDKYENWAIRNGARGVLTELSRASTMAVEAQSQLDALAKDASTAKVAFYILSPGSTLARGLGAGELSGSAAGGAGLSATAAAAEGFEGESPLLQLAEATGGKARTRNMDIAGLLGEVRDDFGTFYSLGYQPQVEAKEGSRKIVIKVKGRPDAKVRYTHNLSDQDPVEQLRELTLSALYHGLTENPLRIELDPKPNPQAIGNDRFRVDVMVKVPFEKILLLPQEDSHVGRLTLFVVVQDHKNQNLSSMSRVEVPITIPNEQLLQVMAQKAAYPLKLEMQGGPQRLAIGMRDHLARVSSTIEVDFEVPDSMAAAGPGPEDPIEAPPAGGPSGGAR